MSRVYLFKCFYHCIWMLSFFPLNEYTLLLCMEQKAVFLIESEKRKMKWVIQTFWKSIVCQSVVKPFETQAIKINNFIIPLRWNVLHCCHADLRWEEPNSLCIKCLLIAFSFGLNGWRADIIRMICCQSVFENTSRYY